jgi:hypothetical protein
MDAKYSFSLALLTIAPGVVGVIATGLFLWRYERSRHNQSVAQRFGSDLLGPLSLLVPKAESKESRPWLLRTYISGGLTAVYGVLLVAMFG